MSTKDWKNGEINTLLNEKWGFTFKVDALSGKKEVARQLNENKGTKEVEVPTEDEDPLEEMGCPHDDEGGQEMVVSMGGDDATGTAMVDGEEVGVTDVDDAEGAANELLALAHKIAGMLGQDSSVTSVPDGDEEADLEERRGRGRENHTIRGPKDNRLRPEGKELSEAQIRTLIRKALKEAAKIKGK